MLIRHAKAEAGDSHSDHDRPLTMRGEDDAWDMGFHMSMRNINPDAAIVSSAKRSRRTFEVWEEKAMSGLKPTFERALYLASYETLLEHIAVLDDSLESPLIIGHNPGLSKLASELTDTRIQMRPIQFVHLTTELDTWQAAATAGAWTLVRSWTKTDLQNPDLR